MTDTIASEPSSATPGQFREPDAARVWNYWFAHRDLTGATQAVSDPFADDYVLAQALWFRGGPEIDAEVALHFEPLLRRAAADELDAWRDTPRECLALLLLLDQFPRNMYRGTAQAFAYDESALALARDALARGRVPRPGLHARVILSVVQSPRRRGRRAHRRGSGGQPHDRARVPGLQLHRPRGRRGAGRGADRAPRRSPCSTSASPRRRSPSASSATSSTTR